jgi:hypothetical protein
MKALPAFAILAVVAAFLFIPFFTAADRFSGVTTGSEYSYVTTATTTGAGEMIKSGGQYGCTLGSIVITDSSTTTFSVMNATSTTDSASTTLASFPANAVAGTYIFDLACDRGLSVVAPAGFDGFVVITYR